MLAAVDDSVALERVALATRPGRDPAGIVAALLDGVTYVVVRPDAPLTTSERRRLLARARERRAGLVSTSEREHAGVRVVVVAHRWPGIDRGARYLHYCALDVARTARHITDRWTDTLPTFGNSLVNDIDGQARPTRSTGPPPLRLVV